MSIQAFILAAGLGSRLRPLTEQTPKPMIEVNGKKLIEYHLERLSKEGVREVMINLHYLPEQIRGFVRNGADWGLNVSYSYEPKLLDTGGGIKNVERWINGASLLIINSDALFDSSFSYAPIVLDHHRSGAKMTLLVGQAQGSFTPLYADSTDRLVGFGRSYVPTDHEKSVNYLGVMVICRSLIAHMPQRGVAFSLTSDVIPGLLQNQAHIRCFEYNGFWSDVGTLERLNQAQSYFSKIL